VAGASDDLDGLQQHKRCAGINTRAVPLVTAIRISRTVWPKVSM